MPTKDDNIHIVEGFVWLKIDHRQTEHLLCLDANIFDIYQLHDDGSESNVPTYYSFLRAIEQDKNAQFAIEVGHLPNNYTQIENNDEQVKQ